MNFYGRHSPSGSSPEALCLPQLVDSDEWELLGGEDFADKSEALDWYRGVMTGSRSPLDII